MSPQADEFGEGVEVSWPLVLAFLGGLLLGFFAAAAIIGALLFASAWVLGVPLGVLDAWIMGSVVAVAAIAWSQRT